MPYLKTVTQYSGFKAILVALLTLYPALTVWADFDATVIGVKDGDTIVVVDSAGAEFELDLAAIDAPELEQPHGHASRQRLLSLLDGKPVWIETAHSELDTGITGKVWVQPADCPECGTTLNVNYAQILSGMAWWRSQYAAQQSPEDRGRYQSAEAEAKARKWGLWIDPGPVNPGAWRLGVRHASD